MIVSSLLKKVVLSYKLSEISDVRAERQDTGNQWQLLIRVKDGISPDPVKIHSTYLGDASRFIKNMQSHIPRAVQESAQPPQYGSAPSTPSPNASSKKLQEAVEGVLTLAAYVDYRGGLEGTSAVDDATYHIMCLVSALVAVDGNIKVSELMLINTVLKTQYTLEDLRNISTEA